MKAQEHSHRTILSCRHTSTRILLFRLTMTWTVRIEVHHKLLSSISGIRTLPSTSMYTTLKLPKRYRTQSLKVRFQQQLIFAPMEQLIPQTTTAQTAILTISEHIAAHMRIDLEKIKFMFTLFRPMVALTTTFLLQYLPSKEK